jgi:hypothetical protein
VAPLPHASTLGPQDNPSASTKLVPALRSAQLNANFGLPVFPSILVPCFRSVSTFPPYIWLHSLLNRFQSTCRNVFRNVRFLYEKQTAAGRQGTPVLLARDLDACTASKVPSVVLLCSTTHTCRSDAADAIACSLCVGGDRSYALRLIDSGSSNWKSILQASDFILTIIIIIIIIILHNSTGRGGGSRWRSD